MLLSKYRLAYNTVADRRYIKCRNPLGEMLSQVMVGVVKRACLERLFNRHNMFELVYSENSIYTSFMIRTPIQTYFASSSSVDRNEYHMIIKERGFWGKIKPISDGPYTKEETQKLFRTIMAELLARPMPDEPKKVADE